MNFEERTKMLAADKDTFCKKTDEPLVKRFHLIKTLVDHGTYFLDYDNAFMKAAFDAGVKDITKNGEGTSEGFTFPSYVEDIMDPMLFDCDYDPLR